MKESQNCPPILYLVFNRPDLTQQVFERIRRAQPRQLFVAADGPRSDVPEDQEKCERARQAIELVDWECDVHTLFRDTNLGCKNAVSSAIAWFFEQVESGIILEDDCVPTPSFFLFCQELLEKYKNDERIMMISGDYYLQDYPSPVYSYYFSHYTHIWGWATWRRAWKHYDGSMKLWPEIRDSGLLSTIYDTPYELAHRSACFENTYTNDIDTWDYAWSFACLVQNGLVIRPEVNLVSNIGFGQDSTHTKSAGPNANFPSEAVLFPLQHPPFVMADELRDRAEVDFLLAPHKERDTKAIVDKPSKVWEWFSHKWRALQKRIPHRW